MFLPYHLLKDYGHLLLVYDVARGVHIGFRIGKEHRGVDTLHGIAENPDIPRFQMYTEVVQDAVMDLMENGKCNFASTCALAFSDDAMLHFMDNINFFRDKLLMVVFR